MLRKLFAIVFARNSLPNLNYYSGQFFLYRDCMCLLEMYASGPFFMHIIKAKRMEIKTRK
jgi:hypothetical protein